jgi:hypothetical protein
VAKVSPDSPPTLAGALRTRGGEAPIKGKDSDAHHRVVGVWVSGSRLADYAATLSQVGGHDLHDLDWPGAFARRRVSGTMNRCEWNSETKTDDANAVIERTPDPKST